MITRTAIRPQRAAVPFLGPVILSVFLGWTAATSFADGPASRPEPAQPAQPDSVLPSATLRVETIPPGLEVLIDGRSVGMSPAGPLILPAKHVRVQVVTGDPRRFDTVRDAADVTLRPGAAVTLTLDVRPSVLLRTEPEPASVSLTARDAGAPDSLLGETPISIPPALLGIASLRFWRESYADTIIPGAAFVDASGVPLRVTLRRSNAGPEPAVRAARLPLRHRRWFQWTLVGAGTLLSGAAVYFHHKGDDWYEQYLASSDVDEIPELYDRAVRCDRLAAISLGVGQVTLIGGIILLLQGQSR